MAPLPNCDSNLFERCVVSIHDLKTGIDYKRTVNVYDQCTKLYSGIVESGIDSSVMNFNLIYSGQILQQKLTFIDYGVFSEQQAPQIFLDRLYICVNIRNCTNQFAKRLKFRQKYPQCLRKMMDKSCQLFNLNMDEVTFKYKNQVVSPTNSAADFDLQRGWFDMDIFK